MQKSLKTILSLMLVLSLLASLGAGITTSANTNTGSFTDYNKDFEDGIINDNYWHVENGWTSLNVCPNNTYKIVQEGNSKALKISFTAQEDADNVYYVTSIPFSILDPNKYYKVTATVKGTNFENIGFKTWGMTYEHDFYANITSTNYKKIHRVFCPEGDSTYNDCTIAIFANGKTNNHTTTISIDSITVSCVGTRGQYDNFDYLENFDDFTKIDEPFYKPENFNVYIQNEFFDKLSPMEQQIYTDKLNSPAVLKNLDEAAGYLSELTSYSPKIDILSENVHGGIADTILYNHDYRYINLSTSTLKGDINHVYNPDDGKPDGDYCLHGNEKVAHSFNDNGRMLSTTLVHELGHAYTLDEWNFSPEDLTDFLCLYVFDKMNEKNTIFNDGLEEEFGNEYLTCMGGIRTRDSYASDFLENENFNNQIKNYGVGYTFNSYYNLGVAGALSKIQKEIGWQPFINTFAEYKNNSPISSNATRYEKFNTFINLLQEKYNELHPLEATGTEVRNAVGKNEFKYLKKAMELITAVPYRTKAEDGTNNIYGKHTVTFLDENDDVVEIRIVNNGETITNIPNNYNFDALKHIGELTNITENKVIREDKTPVAKDNVYRIQNVSNSKYLNKSGNTVKCFSVNNTALSVWEIKLNAQGTECNIKNNNGKYLLLSDNSTISLDNNFINGAANYNWSLVTNDDGTKCFKNLAYNRYLVSDSIGNVTLSNTISDAAKWNLTTITDPEYTVAENNNFIFKSADRKTYLYGGTYATQLNANYFSCFGNGELRYQVIDKGDYCYIKYNPINGNPKYLRADGSNYFADSTINESLIDNYKWTIESKGSTTFSIVSYVYKNMGISNSSNTLVDVTTAGTAGKWYKYKDNSAKLTITLDNQLLTDSQEGCAYLKYFANINLYGGLDAQWKVIYNCNKMYLKNVATGKYLMAGSDNKVYVCDYDIDNDAAFVWDIDTYGYQRYCLNNVATNLKVTPDYDNYNATEDSDVALSYGASFKVKLCGISN
jgi:hypothetical protein